MNRIERAAYDIRLAARSLRRRQAYLIITTATLALGIGATTAVFSLVDAALLRPLPYAEPDRLARVWMTFPTWRNDPVLGSHWNIGTFSYDEYEQLKARTRTSVLPTAPHGQARSGGVIWMLLSDTARTGFDPDASVLDSGSRGFHNARRRPRMGPSSSRSNPRCPRACAHGLPGVRESLAAFMAMKGTLDLTVTRVLEAGGLALVAGAWSFRGTAPDGSAVTLTVHNAHVLRRSGR